MARWRPNQTFARLSPDRLKIHLRLETWADWCDKYAQTRCLVPLEQIITGGVMSNKRRKLFPVPYDVQRTDLAVAALHRSDRQLGAVLSSAYHGQGLYEDRAAALGLTLRRYIGHLAEARAAVGTAFQLLKHRDLIGRSVMLLSKDPL